MDFRGGRLSGSPLTVSFYYYSTEYSSLIVSCSLFSGSRLIIPIIFGLDKDELNVDHEDNS